MNSMLQLLIGIIGIILTIFFVIGIHEFGHFLLAKILKVKVLRFSIGFGKPFYRWYDKSGTEYALAPIPLGGYVKLLDENEAPVPSQEAAFAFNRQPIWKRFLIVAAGPVFNFVFAFLIYWFLFSIGFIASIPFIGEVTPQSIADNAGLKSQQEIIAINDVPTPKWDSIVINLLPHAGNKDKITITTRTQDVSKAHTLDLTHWEMDKLKPDPLESLGIAPLEPTIPTVVGHIAENSPAVSQLQLGDKILAVNGTKVSTWQDLAKIIDEKPDTRLKFKVQRKNQTLDLDITTGSRFTIFFQKRGFLGIAPDFVWPKNLLREHKYPIPQAFTRAYQEFKDFFYLNFLIVGKMLTGKISFASLGGPITIFESAGTAINHGAIAFLSFLAFLSIAIGFINILPIPGLDGGHLFFQLIEVIFRRPVPIRWQLLFYRLGFILLFLLLAQALVNDIHRL